MISYSIFLVLFSTLMSFEVLAQFPQSDPYKWNPLSSETNRKLGSYGGGNGQSGSINIAGQQRINPKWEFGGKVGIDYFPGGTNRRADVGLGYNINKNTHIRGSIGADNNRFGTNPRAGIGFNYDNGRKTQIWGSIGADGRSQANPRADIGFNYRFGRK